MSQYSEGKKPLGPARWDWDEPLDPLISFSSYPDFLIYLLRDVEIKEIHLRKYLFVGKRLFGRMSRADFARWLHDRSFCPTEPQQRRLNDLRVIVGLLVNCRLLYPEEAGRFLCTRCEELDHQRPLAVLGKGEFNQVREFTEKFVADLAMRWWYDLFGFDEEGNPLPPAPPLLGEDGLPWLPPGMKRVKARRPPGTDSHDLSEGE